MSRLATRPKADEQEAISDAVSEELPERLLEIFEKLESGDLSEDQAVEALEERRRRRYGRVGRFLEAITS